MPHSITSINPARNTEITQAVREASASTGTGFSYLMNAAMRESSLNPQAKASTSSASGMFQFIEQTWLGMVKRHGAEHGLAAQAAEITQDPSGRYNVPDAAQRREILALRKDPGISALMAGELTAENRNVLENRLDREVTSGELYAAHVLGAGGAARLINASEQNPSARAATLFPAAARANHGIFYENGRTRSVAEVTAYLTDEPQRTEPAAVYAANIPSGAAGLPGLPVSSSGGSLAGLGHHSQILSPEMIAIMASLDMPSSGRTDRPRQQDILDNPFGLTG